MAATGTPTQQSIAELRSRVSGPVFARGEPGLAEEVTCFNTIRNHDPDVVVGAAEERDVVAAVRFAVAEGLPVRVQATGHGTGPGAAGGLIITTGRLDTLRIDQQERTAAVGAGLQWRPVVDAAADLGLAPIVGSSVTVGAVGYTLGGGIGPLIRSHGFSSDWVRGFRVVTAASEIVEAHADSNPELFWALRGGKGGLGVVTEMTLELARLPVLYAGGLYFEGEDNIEAALRAWVDWLADAPESVSTSAALLRVPDEPSPPERLRGRKLLHLRFAFAGEASEGMPLVAPLRASAPAYLDTVGELSPRHIHSIHHDPESPQPLKSFCRELTGIDQAVVDDLLQKLGPQSDSPFVEAELRHLGGAAARDTAETSAVGGRSGALMLRLVVERADAFAAAEVLAAQVFGTVAPYSASVTNVNFAGSMANRAAFDAAWPEAMGRRLREVRAEVDPNRVFPFGPS